MLATVLQADLAWEDKPANHARLSAAVAAAAPAPGSLVVLPELCDVGFTMDAQCAARGDSLAWGSALAACHGVWLLSGVALPHNGGISNCAVIHDPAGRVAATYRKTFLFTPAGERSHYVPGDGPVIVECAGMRIAPMVCYDLRFPELWRRAALDGAEAFVCIASWPSARQAHWDALLLARAIENQAFVVGCNRVGTDPKATYSGGSAVISPRGEILAHAGSGPGTISATLDEASLRDWRTQFPALADAQPGILCAK